jgi:hypothetical protein
MSAADRYREWLRNFPREPAVRMATAQAAVDAFESCEQKQRVRAADLSPLVVAASSPHKLAFETGCNLLVLLAARHSEAQQCLLEMAKGKNATARFHAVAYLGPDLPEPLRLEIVELALGDRSAKVRQKGIEGAERFKFSRFLAELEEMQRTETNEAVRESLALHVLLLRDGFRLEPSRDGTGYFLTVRGPRSLGGPFIPKEKYSEEFVRDEVARLQAGNPWD